MAAAYHGTAGRTFRLSATRVDVAGASAQRLLSARCTGHQREAQAANRSASDRRSQATAWFPLVRVWLAVSGASDRGATGLTRRCPTPDVCANRIRNSRASRPVGVESLTERLDVSVEVRVVQNLIQSNVEWMCGAARQGLRGHPHRRLPVAPSSTHRHRCSIVRGLDRVDPGFRRSPWTAGLAVGFPDR